MSTLKACIKTNKGDINLNLFSEEAPITVGNFINLSQKKYYDGLNFHRVIDNFMIQGGCPFGSGTGSPGYQFEDEVDTGLKHNTPGVLSMANAGPNTNGSQFFITHTPTPHLDGVHTVFGKVVSAEDQSVVNTIEQNDQIISIEIQGDSQALFDDIKSHLAKWNPILENNFPHLKD